ncbi:MAG: hypothetical protein NC120_09165 [Ruminococcus sp.]|nr:hypothetical protein [Ruminococcus sp.]
MKAKEKTRIGKIQVILFLFIMFPLFSLMIVRGLGLEDHMTGREGLLNIIIILSFKEIYNIAVIGCCIMLAVRAAKGIITSRGDMKNPVVSFAAAVFLIAALMFTGITVYHSRFNIQKDRSEAFGDIGLLLCCISDAFTGNYREISIYNAYFDIERHTTSMGRAGTSFHYEYVIRGYDNSPLSRRVLDAQIGEADRNELKGIIPAETETRVTVYERSGFIRSIEPTVCLTEYEGYSYLYTLTYEDGIVTRSSREEEARSLCLCGFRDGECRDITKAEFMINAENSTAFDCYAPEICLYAWIDGKYERVSNIIRREERGTG